MSDQTDHNLAKILHAAMEFAESGAPIIESEWSPRELRLIRMGQLLVERQERIERERAETLAAAPNVVDGRARFRRA